MQKLMSISEYKARQFSGGSQPHDSTIRRWIDNGDIAGRKIGRTYYVSTEALDNPEDGLVEYASQLLGLEREQKHGE